MGAAWVGQARPCPAQLAAPCSRAAIATARKPCPSAPRLAVPRVDPVSVARTRLARHNRPPACITRPPCAQSIQTLPRPNKVS